MCAGMWQRAAQDGRTTCCAARASMRNGVTSTGAEGGAHGCSKTHRRLSRWLVRLRAQPGWADH
eukprot:11915100-Alexandrium_andersonii.AAC.1